MTPFTCSASSSGHGGYTSNQRTRRDAAEVRTPLRMSLGGADVKVTREALQESTFATSALLQQPRGSVWRRRRAGPRCDTAGVLLLWMRRRRRRRRHGENWGELGRFQEGGGGGGGGRRRMRKEDQLNQTLSGLCFHREGRREAPTKQPKPEWNPAA
ncbi:hypothetical protein EYF80_004419 [Liparis tanakae]|uniref:Uncharacterized protein n=1 Tax=Liparis tanakae TaxID=230148 RepID=A0A4Z2J5V6_9TELE|nr:hypothetical protein EYF80_004419 [Liparis tanakae]